MASDLYLFLKFFKFWGENEKSNDHSVYHLEMVVSFSAYAVSLFASSSRTEHLSSSCDYHSV